jgi:hypothetical protein
MASLSHLSIPAPILKSAFWLYVWKVGLPSGATELYVGMTGDAGSGRAQSAMNRVAAHLGRNIKNNALRRYLNSRHIELEHCTSLDLYAYGPVYPKPSEERYRHVRGQVAAIEKRLWAHLKSAGYGMLNKKPRATAPCDESRWAEVCDAFTTEFPNLSRV